MESKKAQHLALFLKKSYPDEISSSSEVREYLLNLPFDTRLSVSMELVKSKGSCANIPVLLHDLPEKHMFTPPQVREIIEAITEHTNKDLNMECNSFIARLIDGCDHPPESVLLDIIGFSPAASNFRFIASIEGQVSDSIERKIKESSNYFFEDRWMIGDTDRFFIYNNANNSLFSTYLSRLDDFFSTELLNKLIRNGMLISMPGDEPSYADAFIERDGIDVIARKVSDIMLKENIVFQESTPHIIKKFAGTNFLPRIMEKSSDSQAKAIALMMIPNLKSQETPPVLSQYIKENAVNLMMSVSRADFDKLISILDKTENSDNSYINDYLNVHSRVLFGEETPGRVILDFLQNDTISFEDADSLSDSYLKLATIIRKIGIEGIAKLTNELCGKAVKNLMAINPEISPKQCAALFPKSRHQLISSDIGL